jgi:YgiT-type zinc finger domain-containing protein
MMTEHLSCLSQMSITCYFCGGRTAPEIVTDLYSETGLYIAVEKVPADVCQQCGERYFSAEITDRLLGLTTAAKRRKTMGSRVEVVVYDMENSERSPSERLT